MDTYNHAERAIFLFIIVVVAGNAFIVAAGAATCDSF